MVVEGAFAPPDELGALPPGWRWTRLQELIDQDRGICYGIVQPGKHDPNGVPMVNSQDIVGGRVSTRIEFRVSPVLHKQYRRSTIMGGDVLLTLVGANFGQVAVAPPNLAGFNCSRAVGIIPVIECPEFVALCLRSPLARRYMDNWANTTAQPTFNLKDVASLPIPLPPTSERDAITHILGTLDDKIELNRRMNETLEAMARAIFKSWFVDFDPVRAKAEGRDPGLPKHIADLFPDFFEDSELGEIPRGWEVGPILKQAKLVSGGTPKTDHKEYWDGDIPWASAKDVSQCGQTFLVNTERSISQRGLDESATQLIPAFCTVVVARGATTGRMAMFGRQMAMNQTCYGLASATDTPFTLYCHLQYQMDNLVHSAHGSVFDTITTSTFANSKVVLPPVSLLKALDQRVTPMFHRILGNIEESQTLAAVRDTLLPKLISGELRVIDVKGKALAVGG